MENRIEFDGPDCICQFNEIKIKDSKMWQEQAEEVNEMDVKNYRRSKRIEAQVVKIKKEVKVRVYNFWLFVQML